jgi:hypothetical protein
LRGDRRAESPDPAPQPVRSTGAAVDGDGARRRRGAGTLARRSRRLVIACRVGGLDWYPPPRQAAPRCRPGDVAEWLRQGPAKPCTRVRFPASPPAAERELPAQRLSSRGRWSPSVTGRSAVSWTLLDAVGAALVSGRCRQPSIRPLRCNRARPALDRNPLRPRSDVAGPDPPRRGRAAPSQAIAGRPVVGIRGGPESKKRRSHPELTSAT